MFVVLSNSFSRISLAISACASTSEFGRWRRVLQGTWLVPNAPLRIECGARGGDRRTREPPAFEAEPRDREEAPERGEGAERPGVRRGHADGDQQAAADDARHRRGAVAA